MARRIRTRNPHRGRSSWVTQGRDTRGRFTGRGQTPPPPWWLVLLGLAAIIAIVIALQ